MNVCISARAHVCKHTYACIYQGILIILAVFIFISVSWGIISKKRQVDAGALEKDRERPQADERVDRMLASIDGLRAEVQLLRAAAVGGEAAGKGAAWGSLAHLPSAGAVVVSAMPWEARQEPVAGGSW